MQQSSLRCVAALKRGSVTLNARGKNMKRLNKKAALSVAAIALLTTAAYAQRPDRHIYHTGTVRAHEIHTGIVRQPAAIYNQAAPYGSFYSSNDADTFGSSEQPLYDAAVSPEGEQSFYDAAVPVGNDLYGVACVGGRGVGRYPNGMASGQSEATMESGGEFFLDRGYRGCFAVPAD